jgi:hypothetical protein
VKLEQTVERRRVQEAIIPSVEFKTRDGNFETGMAAYFDKHVGDNGTIFVDRNYPVIEAAITEQQRHYAERDEDDIGQRVMEGYKIILQAAAAHAQYLTSVIPAELCKIDSAEASEKGGMLSPEALTACLLGEVTQGAYISTIVGGRFGARRVP